MSPHPRHSLPLCCPHCRGWMAEATPGPSTYMPEGSGHTVHPPLTPGHGRQEPPRAPPQPSRAPKSRGGRASASSRMWAPTAPLLSCARAPAAGWKHRPTHPHSGHRTRACSPQATRALGPRERRPAGGRRGLVWRSSLHPLSPAVSAEAPTCSQDKRARVALGRGAGGRAAERIS